MDESNIPELIMEIDELKEKIERYEKFLKECIEQDGLMDFLDKNDWATQEDYFSHLGKEALNK